MFKSKLKIIKILICFSIILTCFFSCGCEYQASGSIDALSNPHMGEYKCVKAILGEENLLDKFKEIKLELKTNDKYVLTYQLKEGEIFHKEGKYYFDRKTNNITITENFLGKEYGKTFQVVDGIITITGTFFKKQLLIQFEMK